MLWPNGPRLEGRTDVGCVSAVPRVARIVEGPVMSEVTDALRMVDELWTRQWRRRQSPTGWDVLPTVPKVARIVEGPVNEVTDALRGLTEWWARA